MNKAKLTALCHKISKEENNTQVPSIIFYSGQTKTEPVIFARTSQNLPCRDVQIKISHLKDHED